MGTNAALALTSNGVEQLQGANGNFDEVKFEDMMTDAFISGAVTKFGGGGGGGKYLNSLSKQLINRVGKAISTNSTKELKNALSYYYKSSSKAYVKIMKGILYDYFKEKGSKAGINALEECFK